MNVNRLYPKDTTPRVVIFGLVLLALAVFGSDILMTHVHDIAALAWLYVLVVYVVGWNIVRSGSYD